MKRMFCLILFLITIQFTNYTFACDETCDKCSKDSEFSWNPVNIFVTSNLRRFYDLSDEIDKAFLNRNYDLSRRLINEYLDLASIYKCNWNYGNAIHDSNIKLGLISLEEGDVDLAGEYLKKAGKSTGSPQLDTFGPELDLANKLLKANKADEVKVYLTDIKIFWENNDELIYRWL